LPKTTQLTLSHENLPGMLAHIAKVLGDGQVNILAFLTTTVNITLGYATGGKSSKKTCVVLAVSDLDKADTIR